MWWRVIPLLFRPEAVQPLLRSYAKLCQISMDALCCRFPLTSCSHDGGSGAAGGAETEAASLPDDRWDVFLRRQTHTPKTPC